MGLYSGGLISRRIFASEICGAYFWEGLIFFFLFGGGGGGGLLSEFYSMLCNGVLTFETVDEILKCNHSDGSYRGAREILCYCLLRYTGISI